jgi:enoyl-[acyl-carrier protein] reductase II
MRGDDADLVRDPEISQDVDRALHHGQVGVATHDHANQRTGHGSEANGTIRVMQTRLTEMLGIEHPVMLAGMGGVSFARLVAAVSEAGGFGTLGAATMSSEELASEMQQVRELTAAPFGVDLLAALPERMVSGAREIVKGGASLFVAGLGVPREIIEVLHEGNVLVASMCGKVRHAIAAVEAGCDFVIAQGTEAGGHTGTVATFPLVPQIVDEVGDRVPVVAAGGIFDGRGLAAALALGADGVWIGTRFIATPEARTVPGYKEALLRTPEDGTVISRGFTGKTLRAVRNEWTQYVEEHPEELAPFPEQMMRAVAAKALHLGGDENADVDPDKECYPAGQGVGAIHELVPAGDLVRQIVEEAERALARASSYA